MSLSFKFINKLNKEKLLRQLALLDVEINAKEVDDFSNEDLRKSIKSVLKRKKIEVLKVDKKMLKEVLPLANLGFKVGEIFVLPKVPKDELPQGAKQAQGIPAPRPEKKGEELGPVEGKFTFGPHKKPVFSVIRKLHLGKVLVEIKFNDGSKELSEPENAEQNLRKI